MTYLVYFLLSFLFYVILFFLSLRGERRSRLFYRIGLVPPVFLNGMALLDMILRSGHLPSHFLFERFVQLGFGLGLLLWLISFFEDTRRLFRYVLIMILIMFGLCFLFPMDLKLATYRYTISWARLFFQIEALSFVLMVFASAYCLQYLMENNQVDDGKKIIVKERIYLLMGFVAFLASQFFGSVWSLQGWGDYWMWGKMSFIGVVMWFYIMFIIHSRYVRGFGETFEAGIGVSLFLMILVYRMVWQP